MSLPIGQANLFSKFSKAPALCFCLLGALAFSSCSKSPDEKQADQLELLERYLAEEGIERIPAKQFDFPPLREATELSSTEVLSNLNADVSTDKNLVYCATAKLVEEIERRALAPQDLSAMTERLADELPEGSYRFLDGTAQEVQNQLAEDHPSTSESLSFLNGRQELSGWHFHRSLPFLEAFERLKEPLEFQSATGTLKVACFGDRRFEEGSVQQTLRKEQITVIDFQGEDDFIVRLNTTETEDEMILAKVAPEQNLENTLRKVMRRVEQNPFKGSDQSEIQEGEALVVPIVTLNLLKWFSENPPVFQSLRFRLDEKGAVIDAFLGYYSLGSEVILRQMIFDKPFLLYIRSKQADVPYLVLWVENLEVMEEFTPEAEE